MSSGITKSRPSNKAAARALRADAAIEVQAERLGTGHAVLSARGTLANTLGDAVVLYADTPFIRPETLAAMRDARGAGADVVSLVTDITLNPDPEERTRQWVAFQERNS